MNAAALAGTSLAGTSLPGTALAATMRANAIPGGLSAAGAGAGNSMKSAAEGFESLFLGVLLEPMEKAGAAFFGEGPAGRVFGGMFRTQIAQKLAQARPLGIADRIELTLQARAKAAQQLKQKE